MLTQEQARRTLQILRDALTLLETKGWTQGTSARDARGEPVPVQALEAVCFCSLGALLRAAGPGTSPTDYVSYAVARAHLVRAAAGATGAHPGCFSIADFNDTAPDFEPVRRMFQTAIKNLEALCAE